MCRRALESNGEMRTRRCTPDSVFSQPCALWPLTMIVADLMPASSPSVSSSTSTSKFRRSPQRTYMRSNMRAQSQLSVPPAPECTSTIGIEAVRLARQQRLQLAPLALRLQPPKLCETLVLGLGIAFHLAEFDQRRGVVEVALDLGYRPEPILQHRPLAHQLLRGLGIVPEIGVLGFGVEFGETSRRSLDVKDASSAVPRTA